MTTTHFHLVLSLLLAGCAVDGLPLPLDDNDEKPVDMSQPDTEKMPEPGQATFVFDNSCDNVRVVIFVGDEIREPFAGPTFQNKVPRGALAVDVPCTVGQDACYGAVQTGTGHVWGRGDGSRACSDCCTECVSFDAQDREEFLQVLLRCP